MREAALVGTGRIISSLGEDVLDDGRRFDAPAIAAPELFHVAAVRAVAVRPVESPAMDLSVWHERAALCTDLARQATSPASSSATAPPRWRRPPTRSTTR